MKYPIDTATAFEVVFTPTVAIVTMTKPEGVFIRRMTHRQAGMWLVRRNLPWTWTVLEDGTPQAIWERDL